MSGIESLCLAAYCAKVRQMEGRDPEALRLTAEEMRALAEEVVGVPMAEPPAIGFWVDPETRQAVRLELR